MQRSRTLILGLTLGLLTAATAGGLATGHGGRVLAATTQVLAGGAQMVQGASRGPGPIRVATADELMAALKTARGGDTILLAPGVYADMKFKVAPAFDEAVTIKSADPSKPAVVTDFTMSAARGLTFRDLIFATLDHPDKIANDGSFWAYKFFRSSNIHFDNIQIHGSLDGNPANDVSGISLRNCQDVSIRNSEFQQLERAVTVGQTGKVRLTGNRAHDLRSDGFDLVEVTDVEISGNTLWNFFPADGDHPDAIQFWTTHAKTPSTDILISRNVIHRGDGRYTQGIFLRDQVGTLPYERVTISENLVVGTGYNGLRIGGAVDMTILDNELISYVGDKNTFFLVKRGNRITARNNRAIAISFDDSTNVVESGNSLTKAVKDRGRGAVGKWLAKRPFSAPQIQAVFASTAAGAPSLR